MAAPPGETNRLFVVERAGRIIVITNLVVPNRTVFLDVTNSTESTILETGLLGLVFHPGFATNRTFFTFRTLFTSSPAAIGGFHDQLSRYQVDPQDPNRALAGSETPVLVQLDDNATHNGGDLHFGSDGYLYVSFGDEGPPLSQASPLSQSIDRHLFGTILRLDVDRRPGSLLPNPHPSVTSEYRIPPDNPFVGATVFQGLPVNPDEVRTEIYALGFRNPWRFWIDPLSGNLYCGDVGSSTIEEIDLVEAGGNYGWPYLEGDLPNPFASQLPPVFEPKPPLATYTHGNKSDQGNSVVGGLIYRGSALPGLYGHYIFGDHVRGQVWAIDQNIAGSHAPVVRLTADAGLCAFATDPRDGEILLANFRDGQIRRLVYHSPEITPLPTRLSETGAFSDLASLTPNPGIIPFQVAVPFWSDHALKSRWFALPDATSKIGFRETGNWQFPVGMVWIKHFELELTNGVPESRRRLETRFLVRNHEGVYGVTYRWNEDQQDATLVAESGRDEQFIIRDGANSRLQTWRYPSRAECVTCHSELGGLALGFNTAQLNRETDYGYGPVNQIEALRAAGYIDGIVPAADTLWRLARSDDTTQPFHHRLKSYFAANCVYCHQPGSRSALGAVWDARIQTSLATSGLLASHLVTPYNPASSFLHYRISVNDLTRMPPIGSSEIDSNAVVLVEDWINTLLPGPWQGDDIGDPPRYGGALWRNGVCEVSGAGTGIGTALDSFYFVHAPLTTNGQIVSRLVTVGSNSGQAGLVLRQSTNAGAMGAAILVSADGQVRAQFRLEPDVPAIAGGTASITLPCWLCLAREGSLITASFSRDGLTWQLLDSQPVSLPSLVDVGLGASSQSPYSYLTAQFDNADVMSIRIIKPVEGSRLTVPAPVTITAEVLGLASDALSVAFRSDGHLIGTAAPPYSFTWSNPPAGTHELTAHVIHPSGATVSSPPVIIHADLPSALAAILGTDNLTQGNWIGQYGRRGFAAPGIGTNLPEASLSLEGAGEIVWSTTTLSSPALSHPAGGRVAAAWTNDSELTIDLDLNAGVTRQISLYFLEWLSYKVLAVDILDRHTGTQLAHAEFRTIQTGSYLKLAGRGALRILIRPLIGPPATLSGIFIDDYSQTPPSVQLTAPADQTILRAPVNLALAAQVVLGDRSAVSVEFYANSELIGTVLTPPYAITITNMLEGDYEIVARAVDDLGFSAQSEPAWVRMQLPPAQARFLGSDEVTQGDWIGHYGQEGAWLAALESTVAVPLSIKASPNELFIWTWTESDRNALQTPINSQRIAACWVDSETLEFQVAIQDGHPRQLALYFLEWNSDARFERVEWSDPTTGAVLDSREVRRFSQGRYLIYLVTGRARLRVTRLQSNAVLSAFFFDPPPGPYRQWQMQSFPSYEWSDNTIVGELANPDADPFNNYLEFALGLDPLGPDASPYLAVTRHDSEVELVFRRVAGGGVPLGFEASDNLVTWQRAGDEVRVVQTVPEGLYEKVTARLPATKSIRFLRLTVERP